MTPTPTLFGGPQEQLSCGEVNFHFIGPGVLACATHGCGRSEAGHCFHLLSFFFLSFYAFLLFNHFGETPVRENLFPPIFWHNMKEYLKKIKVIFFYE